MSGHWVRSICCRYSRVSNAEVCLGTVQSEIAALEERLRVAELGRDPEFFEEALADDVVLVSQNGDPAFAKRKVIEAHQPGKGPKFTRVEMRNMNIIDHGTAAVVTCEGTFEGPQSTITLKFMRVWLKRNNRWQIVAGFVSA
jgi:ketosteroid isomerase-like protein